MASHPPLRDAWTLFDASRTEAASMVQERSWIIMYRVLFTMLRDILYCSVSYPALSTSTRPVYRYGASARMAAASSGSHLSPLASSFSAKC